MDDKVLDEKKMNIEQITDLGISYMTQPTYR
jgi:hypothetical protein